MYYLDATFTPETRKARESTKTHRSRVRVFNGDPRPVTPLKGFTCRVYQRDAKAGGLRIPLWYLILAPKEG